MTQAGILAKPDSNSSIDAEDAEYQDLLDDEQADKEEAQQLDKIFSTVGEANAEQISSSASTNQATQNLENAAVHTANAKDTSDQPASG